MELEVRVHCAGPDRPAEGSVVLVEVHDAPLADAPSEVVARAAAPVRSGTESLLACVEVALERLPESGIVRAHVDLDGDGRASPGDYLTTASYPVPGDPAAGCDVTVRRI